jgi:hypothetical protein
MQSREERLKCRKERQRQQAAGRLTSACFRSLAEARRLIEEDPGCVRYQGSAGETAFKYVVVENRLDLAEFLPVAGSDIDEPDNFGTTPLMDAIALNHREMVNWLLDRGASIEAVDRVGGTALCLATKNEKAWAFQRMITLPRQYPIDHYYDSCEAEDVFDNPDLVMRDQLIKLGLTRRFEY